MKCPTCGAELHQDTRDMSYTYKGETTTVQAVTGGYCHSCGRVVLDREQGERYNEWVALFQRQVNASFVDPTFIIRVRRKLGLDQKQAAEIFGGGVNAFSRYETGKTKPPLALVKLLRLLDGHPELLAELQPVCEG